MNAIRFKAFALKNGNSQLFPSLSLVRVFTALVMLSATSQSFGQPAAATPDDRIRKLEEAVRDLQKQNEELRKLLLQQPPASPTTATAPPVAAPSPTLAKPTLAAQTTTDITPKMDSDVRFFWKDGFNFESRDGKTYKGKIGGRIQYDVAAFEEDDTIKALVGNSSLSSEFRRARLYNSGEILETGYYMLQLEFAGGDFRFADAYVGLVDIPYIGQLQVGQMKEPISLEESTSSNSISFLERGTPVEAFSPARNVGGLVRNNAFNGRMTYAVGIFADDKDDKADGNAFESNTRVTGRLTGLVWSDDESKGRRYVHLGLGGSVINPENDSVRYRARPEAHLAPRYVDTGTFGADMAYLGNLEALVTWGPFSVQGEYFHSWHDASAESDPSFDGWYLYGSWFLTGEHRPYRKSSGTLDRIKPNHNYRFDGSGWGAWELLARISKLDLDDEAIQGGRLTDYTAGLAWYLNPNARLLLNYIYSDLQRDGQDGLSHIFQTRFQIDF